jgi:hypothetical protein
MWRDGKCFCSLPSELSVGGIGAESRDEGVTKALRLLSGGWWPLEEGREDAMEERDGGLDVIFEGRLSSRHGKLRVSTLILWLSRSWSDLEIERGLPDPFESFPLGGSAGERVRCQGDIDLDADLSRLVGRLILES